MEVIIHPKKYYRQNIKKIALMISGLIFNRDGFLIHDLDEEVPLIIEDIKKSVKNRKKLTR